MDQMSFAMSGAKAKAKAAAAAKATAATKPAGKGAAKAKAKSEPGKKRKAAGSEAVIRLETPAAKQSRNGADTEEADNAIIAQFQESVTQLQKNAFVCADTDSAIADCLKQAGKDLSAAMQSIKGKKKSLNRRQSDTAYILSELDAILTDLQQADRLGQALLKCSGEDLDLLESMKELNRWEFSLPLYKRALKCACISNLKFTDWKSFTGNTLKSMENILGKNEAQKFFWLMLNEVTQKLLRSIPVKKAQNHKIKFKVISN